MTTTASNSFPWIWDDRRGLYYYLDTRSGEYAFQDGTRLPWPAATTERYMSPTAAKPQVKRSKTMTSMSSQHLGEHSSKAPRSIASAASADKTKAAGRRGTDRPSSAEERRQPLRTEIPIHLEYHQDVYLVERAKGRSHGRALETAHRALRAQYPYTDVTEEMVAVHFRRNQANIREAAKTYFSERTSTTDRSPQIHGTRLQQAGEESSEEEEGDDDDDDDDDEEDHNEPFNGKTSRGADGHAFASAQMDVKWSPQVVRAWKTYYNTLLVQRRSSNDAMNIFRQTLRAHSPYMTRNQTASFLSAVLQTHPESDKTIEQPARLESSAGRKDAKQDKAKRDNKAGPASQQASSASADMAIATIDLVSLSLHEKDRNNSDLALTYAEVSDGAGQKLQRAEVLLDSGASHGLFSAGAATRLGFRRNDSVKRLPDGQRQQVEHLGVTTPVDCVIHLSWRFQAKDELYSQLLYVVNDLPFDMIVSFATINKYSLFSKGLAFHKADSSDNPKLNSYVLRRQPKATREAQSQTAKEKQKANDAARTARQEEERRRLAAKKAAEMAARAQTACDDSSSESE